MMQVAISITTSKPMAPPMIPPVWAWVSPGLSDEGISGTLDCVVGMNLASLSVSAGSAIPVGLKGVDIVVEVVVVVTVLPSTVVVKAWVSWYVNGVVA